MTATTTTTTTTTTVDDDLVVIVAGTAATTASHTLDVLTLAAGATVYRYERTTLPNCAFDLPDSFDTCPSQEAIAN